MTEKWSIMIKMEKSARGKGEKEAMLTRKKKELRQAVSTRVISRKCARAAVPRPRLSSHLNPLMLNSNFQPP